MLQTLKAGIEGDGGRRRESLEVALKYQFPYIVSRTILGRSLALHLKLTLILIGSIPSCGPIRSTSERSDIVLSTLLGAEAD